MSDKKQSKETSDKQETPKRPTTPARWGLSEAKYMADRENELITVHLRGGALLAGYLVGLDQFVIGLEDQATGKTLLIAKHAIDWIEPDK